MPLSTLTQPKPDTVEANSLFGRSNSISFLRFFLAATVIYVHCFPLGGFEGELLWRWSHHTAHTASIAVQCFFVLSGGLIASSWIRNPSLPAYLTNRILRLVPALVVCLLVTAFIFTPILWLHSGSARPPFFSLEPSAIDYVWRNLLKPRAQGFIGPYPDGTVWGLEWNGSLWTLFYEAGCYVFIALLGVFGLLTKHRKLGGALLLALVVAYSVWVLTTRVFQGTWIPAIVNRLFDTSGKELTIHFFAGALWVVMPKVSNWLLARAWVGPVASLSLIVTWRLGVGGPLTPWLLPAILFWLARALPLANFERQVGGDYSYGLYVYGYPVQQILTHFSVHKAGYIVYLLASLVGAGIWAVGSWHLVERRFLQFKKTRRA